MKLFNSKEESPYLSKSQWAKLFLAFSVLTLVLYIGAMVASLCGSHYFILNFQNEQMDKIENWCRGIGIYSFITWFYSTIEFSIILAFVIKRIPKWYYVVAFYFPMALAACFLYIPNIIFTLYPLLFYLGIPVIEQLKDKTNKFNWKNYAFSIVKLGIAMFVTFVLQVMIYIIKNGSWSFVNQIMNLSATFIYALEYDIALLVILCTISLYINRGKGDSRL